MLNSVAEDACPCAVPDDTLKDRLVRHSRFTDSLAIAFLPRLKIFSIIGIGRPIFSSTFLMRDLETESKPASMSVCIMHTFVLLSFMFSIVVHNVNIASGIEKDFLYA